MQSDFFIDMHCHPSIKAFARSFANKPVGQHAKNPTNESSIWRSDNPTRLDKVKQIALSLTNFVQSDGTNLLAGRVGVAALSFYPLEKAFFVNDLGTRFLADTVLQLATEFGKKRIDHVQSLKSYWDDLKMEMEFVLQREGTVVRINNRDVCYRIARSYDDIVEADAGGELGEHLVMFIPSIEGGHVFDQWMDNNVDWKTPMPLEVLQTMLGRVKELRIGEGKIIRPFFVTFAHHFWNGLCGHERSLGGLIVHKVHQENGLGQGFTDPGREVVRAMLRNDEHNGKALPRIHIDIKHMARAAREEYFRMLDTEFAGQDIPVLVSHGCVTGLPAPNSLTPTTTIANQGVFNTDPINFYDDELLRIEATHGIFAIQLDERRIGSEQAKRKARFNLTRRDMLYNWARLVWNQVQHTAEVLDATGRYAWGIQTLGTDFDGIVDPINGYWTSKSFDDLDDCLLQHAYNFLKSINTPCPLKQDQNKLIKPEDVVERVMTSNALDFLKRYY